MAPKLVLDEQQRIALHGAFIAALRSIYTGTSSNALPLRFEEPACVVLGQILTSSSSTQACADFLKAAGQFTPSEWVKGVKKPTSAKESNVMRSASNNFYQWLEKNDIYTDDDVKFSHCGEDAGDDGDAASSGTDTDAPSVDSTAAQEVKTKTSFSKLPVNVVRYFLATTQKRLEEKPDDGVTRTLSTLRELADGSLCSYMSRSMDGHDYNALKEYFNLDFVPAPRAKDGSTVSIFSIQDDAYIKKLTADLLQKPYTGPQFKFLFDSADFLGGRPNRCECDVEIEFFPIRVTKKGMVPKVYHPSCFIRLAREVRDKCKEHYKHPGASNYGDLSQQLQELVDLIFEFDYDVDNRQHFCFDVVGSVEQLLAKIKRRIAPSQLGAAGRAVQAKKRLDDKNSKRSPDDDEEGGESDSDAGGGGKKPVPSRRGRDDDVQSSNDDDGGTAQAKPGAGKKPPPKRKGKAAQSSSDDEPSSDSASEDDAVAMKPRGKKATAKRASGKK